MMRRWGALWAALIPFLLVGDSQSAEVLYSGKGLRDPFAESAEDKPTGEAEALQGSVESMTVEGILYAMNNPLAIIDGKIYRIGSKLGTGQVLRIEREGVTISQNGKEFILKQSRGKK